MIREGRARRGDIASSTYWPNFPAFLFLLVAPCRFLSPLTPPLPPTHLYQIDRIRNVKGRAAPQHGYGCMAVSGCGVHISWVGTFRDELRLGERRYLP